MSKMSGQQLQPVARAAPSGGQEDFTALLQREFRLSSAHAREAVDTAVRTLAQQALADTQLISGDSMDTIGAIIAAIDRKLTEQTNRIIHDTNFQALESAWRGLQHLVTNTETDEHLKIRVLNISKKDLSRTLRRYKGVAW